MCPLPQVVAIVFSIFFLARNNGNSGECVKPQSFMRRFWRQQSACIVCTVCIGHEHALPCRAGIRSPTECVLCSHSTVRLAPATMLAAIVIPTQSSSHRWCSKEHRCSGHHVGLGYVCSALEGASTLARVSLSVGAVWVNVAMVSII